MSHLFIKRYQWAWFVSLILLSGFLLTSISSYLVTRGNIRETITESTLPLTSDNVYSEIQRDLLQPVFIASLMANDTFLRDWAIKGEQDEDSITRYLHEIKIKYGTVTAFFVSEQTQKYFHAHGLLKTVREGEPRDAWYYRVREMGAPYEINALVLICKESVDALSSISAEAFSELKQITTVVESSLKDLFKYDKINYLMLMMVDPDVHFHILPRYSATRIFDQAEFADPGWPGPPELGKTNQVEDVVRQRIRESLKSKFCRDSTGAG